MYLIALGQILQSNRLHVVKNEMGETRKVYAALLGVCNCFYENGIIIIVYIVEIVENS